MTIALTDTVVLAIRLPARSPIGTRAMAHFYDAGNALAMGLIAAGIVAAWHRWGPRSRLLAYGALTALACAASYPVLVEDMSGPVERLAGQIPVAVSRFGLVFAASLSIPLSAAIGTLLARRWLRLFGVAGGITLSVVNDFSYPQSYPGIHLLGAVVAAVLVGSSLRGAALVAMVTPRSARVRTALTAVAALLGAVSIGWKPSNAVVIELTGQPSAVLSPFLGRLSREVQEKASARIPDGQREWFTNRAALPPLPPSVPPLLRPDPIVILLSVDSMRADLLAEEKYRAKFPELFRLRDESTYFADARAAGSSTAPSLAAIFSGVYYSQQYWTQLKADDALVYPHEDPTPRFPELLAGAGVATVTFDSSGWLLNSFGIVKGFTEEQSFRRGKPYAPASKLVDAARKRLNEHKDGPLFMFMHFLDAHSPYTSAGKKETPFEGYLAELSLVDAEIKRLLEALAAARLMSRTSILVMADHGEAFGEHGLTWHATSLYDELLRVPLLIRVPGGKPSVVTSRVSLVDLGPTILDLMGVATPGRYMGQSLTGYLRGEQPKLTRPIVAEARLKRAMVLPDGFKVIHDSRSYGVEIFDLVRDAREESNVYQDGMESSAERLGALRSFFRTHTYRKKGYKVPYRRW